MVNEFGLTTAQEHYAKYVASGMPKAEAINAVGRSKTMAFNWDHNPAVVARIRTIQQELSNEILVKNKIDRHWVMSNMVKLAERCMQEEPVLDKDGNPTGVYQFDSAGAIKAVHLVGVELGMFKKENTTININTQINQIPGDSLRSMVTTLAAEVLGVTDTKLLP